MAESIFEKPATEGVRLIERLSTEFEILLMLLSAIVAADVSLYFYKKQNILTFNWKFGGETNIGAILTFVLLYSLMMTFISGLIIAALHFLWILLPYRLTSLIDRNKDFNYGGHGYELDHLLERYALSEKDTFLMDLVRRHREAVAKIEAINRKIAQLAVSVIVLIGLDWWISQADRGTFVRVVLGYAETNRLVTLILCLFVFFLVLAVKDELGINQGEPWVLYPPGVDKAKAASQRGFRREFNVAAGVVANPGKPSRPPRLIDVPEHVILVAARHHLTDHAAFDELVDFGANDFRVRASLTRHRHCAGRSSAPPCSYPAARESARL